MPVPPLSFFITKLVRLITALSSERAHVQITITLREGVPQLLIVNRTYTPDKMPEV